jgi:predicted small lipoprotein YifL
MRTLIVLVMLDLLAACGTKTPLTLPSRVAAPAQATATVSPEPTFPAKDDNNKAAASIAQ